MIFNPSDRTASEYVVEEINGTTYLFFELKDEDYTVHHIKPNFYVLKKVPYKPYVETRTYDTVDYPFVDDPEAIGTWEAIDFVETPEEFVPGQRQWQGGELFLKKHIIEPNGQISPFLGKQDAEARWTERKRLGESLLKELGVDPNGKMSEILDKQISELDEAWVKVTGKSFLNQLAVDPNTKMSEILNNAQESGVYSGWNKVFGESFLKKVLNPNTEISEISEIMNKERSKSGLVWTRGLIISPAGRTASRYYIKEIEGSIYMFCEWKTGDYKFRQRKPSYYVLKKK